MKNPATHSVYSANLLFAKDATKKSTFLRVLPACLLSQIVLIGCGQQSSADLPQAGTQSPQFIDDTVQKPQNPIAKQARLDTWLGSALSNEDNTLWQIVIPKKVSAGDLLVVKTAEEAAAEAFSIEARLAKAIPQIDYSLEGLSPMALQVNRASWYGQKNLDKPAVIRMQALLNWHNHGVGAVDGKLSHNFIKAMRAFQKANKLAVTDKMTAETWLALTKNDEIAKRPTLVNYTLTAQDIRIPYHPKGQQFRSVREALAEKFHMSQALLSELNPKKRFRAGEVITVYNPTVSLTTPINRVVVDKKQNLLYAYDNDNLLATYPTTVGSRYTPSPSGGYRVTSRILDPTYNKDFSNKNSVLPPGPNNPVGRVWLGLSKPSFGIHGSPEPEMISRQQSHGCVRLTNWDALTLYSVIEHGAKVEFL